MKKVWLLLVVIAAAIGSGCNDPGTPTSSSDSATLPSTVVYTGTIRPHEASFYSFTVGEAGSVRITLASVAPDGKVGALDESLGVGVGTPAGFGCEMTQTTTVAPALTAQLVADLAAGVHCANVFDAGALTEPLAFTIRIIHP